MWTSSVLFGWIWVVFALKNLIEFAIRHSLWGVWWKRQLNYTNKVSREHLSTDFRKTYGSVRPLHELEYVDEDNQKENIGKCWAVITGVSTPLGAEFCK